MQDDAPGGIQRVDDDVNDLSAKVPRGFVSDVPEEDCRGKKEEEVGGFSWSAGRDGG